MAYDLVSVEESHMAPNLFEFQQKSDRPIISCME